MSVVEMAPRKQRHLGVMLLDLDRFKVINVGSTRPMVDALAAIV